jgi:uncharacterized protein YqgV (UPF0045/DUF77 family)
MGSGKHEVQFVTELEPFVLIDRSKRPQCTMKSQAQRDMHAKHCDQLCMIQNGARMHAALWYGSIVDHDSVILEMQQCRDIRKRRQLAYRMDAINTTIEMHELHGDMVDIALECAIDNAYLQAIGRMSTMESIIPVWYWSI